jgi:pyrroline-5-carboxylate reductase
MARALVGGWLARGARAGAIGDCRSSGVTARPVGSTVSKDCVYSDNATAAAQADVWVMAVKPQQLAEVAADLGCLRPSSIRS